MEKFVVIDTETNWEDAVMSIGAVMADGDTMSAIEARYYILDPEYKAGGMYSDALLLKNSMRPRICSRAEALEDILAMCKLNGAEKIFAYNAIFDRTHLPELQGLVWHDIMKLAAYAQYNRAIPRSAPLCSTGRLRSGYGVEPIMRMLTGNGNYFETHNALQDTLDELKIMSLLGHPLALYP